MFSQVILIFTTINFITATFSAGLLIQYFIFHYRLKSRDQFQPMDEFLLCRMMDVCEGSKFSLWTNEKHVPPPEQRFARFSAPKVEDKKNE